MAMSVGRLIYLIEKMKGGGGPQTTGEISSQRSDNDRTHFPSCFGALSKKGGLNLCSMGKFMDGPSLITFVRLSVLDTVQVKVAFSCLYVIEN